MATLGALIASGIPALARQLGRFGRAGTRHPQPAGIVARRRPGPRRTRCRLLAGRTAPGRGERRHGTGGCLAPPAGLASAARTAGDWRGSAHWPLAPLHLKPFSWCMGRARRIAGPARPRRTGARGAAVAGRSHERADRWPFFYRRAVFLWLSREGQVYWALRRRPRRRPPPGQARAQVVTISRAYVARGDSIPGGANSGTDFHAERGQNYVEATPSAVYWPGPRCSPRHKHRLRSHLQKQLSPLEVRRGRLRRGISRCRRQTRTEFDRT